jgi:hypothetical protein
MIIGDIAVSIFLALALIGGCYATRTHVKKHGTEDRAGKLMNFVFYCCLFLLISEAIYICVLFLGVFE